ncbi:hypothetical protein [Solemya velesiana gill symbiont]|nr:hypothetical protein [Solemya velesiana gill symbiont]
MLQVAVQHGRNPEEYAECIKQAKFDVEALKQIKEPHRCCLDVGEEE